MLASDAKERAKKTHTANKTAWWFGESVTTASTSAACHFGSNRTTGALSASKNGPFNAWASELVESR